VTNKQRILVEGYTIEEVLAFPDKQLDAFVFSEDALAFKIGTATVLGRFARDGESLITELAHIDGGGEGVLPAISKLATAYARKHGLCRVDWRVHALHCAKPNLNLRRVLERRGFTVEQVPGTGECYHRVVEVGHRPGA